MNPLKLALHLLIKDLRHQRIWLALVWLLALAMPFAAPLVREPFSRAGTSYTFATWALIALIGVSIVRLIRLDPPGRELRFLNTRPVPWSALAAGKGLFIALFLLAPLVAARLLTALTLQIPLGFADAVMIAVEAAAAMGALSSAAVVAALFLRGMPRIFAALVLAPMAIGFGGEMYREHIYHSGVMPHWPDVTLDAVRTLMFYIALVATASIVAALRYQGKSLLKPLAALAAGTAVSVAAWSYWPYDFSILLGDNGPVAEPKLPAEMRDRIKLTLTGTEGVNGNSHGMYGMWNGVKYAPFTHEASLEGVEPPYYAVVVDYHGIATLKSGRTISASFHDINSHSSIGGMGTDLMRKIAGLPLEGNGKWNETQFDLFHYFPDQYPKEDLTGVSLKGTVTLEIRKAYVIHTMPFKAGSIFTMPRRRFALTSVAFTQGQAKYNMLAVALPSTLRGDPGWNFVGNDLQWLVFNRAQNECYSTSGNGTSGDSNPFFSLRVLNGTYIHGSDRNDWRAREKPILPTWAEGTEMSFFGSEPCGRIELPYEIKSVDLVH
ncbi:MAG TPA: hypothetical protein VG733_09470 [Chthoniobacteraceae bacterium]|nr:hypothetical protein [Chthoniobacteraceae bacterium]